jgi:hypothetical protein
MTAVLSWPRQFVRGTAGSSVLRSFGIDPRRYWLLMDLFRELSSRREVFGQLGRNAVQLQSMAYLWFVMMALLAAMMLVIQPPVSQFFWLFQLMNAVLLFMVLLPETATTLVNPEEALVMAHHPIDGATYNAAKLSHLLRVVVYLVTGISAAPALVGVFLRGGGPWYPLKHFGAALFAGLTVALICCAIFGWLLRLVPPARLKSVAMLAEITPFLFIVLPKRDLGWLHVPPEYRLYIATALATVGVLGIAGGLHSLRRDYLVRVAAILGSRSKRTRAPRRSRIDEWIARRLGGQTVRAGMAYLMLVGRRDWHFRRAVLVLIPIAIGFAASLFRGSRQSVFGHEFVPAHGFPHIYALVSILVAVALVYGSSHKAIWIFLTFPTGVFQGFARGVVAQLWITLIALPNVVVLAWLSYAWSPLEALLFVLYSAAWASLYLGLSLRLVHGIPFSKPADSVQNEILIPLLIATAVAVAAVVALQYAVIFRSYTVTLITSAVVAGTAWFALRGSTSALEASMRHGLALLADSSKGLYREVDL